jgi:hypothetical protein
VIKIPCCFGAVQQLRHSSHCSSAIRFRLHFRVGELNINFTREIGKMSGEGDSMNEIESEEHEEEEEEDSSSESVDEEIKLTKNFITTLQKISIEGKNYDDFILLVSVNTIYAADHLSYWLFFHLFTPFLAGHCIVSNLIILCNQKLISLLLFQ